LKRLALLSLLSLLALAPPARAVPLQVAHQGVLEDASGPVTGQRDIIFRFFSQDTAGSTVWSETRTVDVVNGNYATILGTQSAIDSVLLTEPALWLELEILGGGSPLVPRVPLVSVPYAIVAGQAAHAAAADHATTATSATNVQGGSADVTEVLVNGTGVIDGSGNWTGGSIDWTDIVGVPAGVLDTTDDDSLANLLCNIGERLKWDGGAWACSPVIDPGEIYSVSVLSGGPVNALSTTVSATCNPGDMVITGGCSSVSGDRRISMSRSSPTTSGWSCTFGNTQSYALDTNGTATALCLDLP
jgi:hypothetical protein